MGFDHEGRRRGPCLKTAPLFLINALLGHYPDWYGLYKSARYKTILKLPALFPIDL